MATGKFDMAGYTTGFYPDPYSDNFLCSTVVSNRTRVGITITIYAIRLG